ncbi:DinB family protein [Paenibacillus allorhizosphaerae]|uniref:DinB-like domain-containing protein n=1 Tax=Paenibacillus allorhizosphaerae TaxID=2849866 RepID=A0ABN7TLX1_9BACL|nr:DinB family protein [Paenibacillus allorhizosphaerae]CAG7646317.1 hypothetical protein PAECIP111802_03715 [Paenibacillus allorhizosphaerae]
MFTLMTLTLLDNELDKIRIALSRLSDEAVWRKGKEGTNSIGNLCLHLAGNEYHNIACSIGGHPYVRERSAEFLAEGGPTCKELADQLVRVRSMSREVLSGLTEEDMGRIVHVTYPPGAGIASYSRPIGELLYHATVHYAYHTGQIVYMTRLLQEQDGHILKWRH